MSVKTRSRANTLPDTTAEAAELRSQIHSLGQACPTSEQHDIKKDTNIKLETAYRIRQTLLDGPEVLHLRDTFRHLDGFHTVIVALRHIFQLLGDPAGRLVECVSPLVSLLQATLAVLAAALQQHKGNQKYFRRRVERGGWSAIEQILCSGLFSSEQEARFCDVHLLKETLGCLLGCALDDDSMTDYFKTLRRRLDGRINSSANKSSVEVSGGNETAAVDLEDCLLAVLDVDITSLTMVHNPEAIRIMLELWKKSRHIEDCQNPTKDENEAIWAVPAVIDRLARSSTRNLVALHGVGLIDSVLEALICIPRNDESRSFKLHNLAGGLLQLGVSNAHNAQTLYQNARSSPLIAELLLSSLRSSRSPPYIHFDLSLHGFASIELPGIGRVFPPTGTSAGYTLSLWFQVTNFDHNAHTTIFGAFDASQTCFVLVYLEKDTHNLILQTSVSSSRPSVRFKVIAFEQQRWYHVVIAHRRPKTTSSSRASLFVDGEFIEQVKSQYPATISSTTKEINNNSHSPSDQWSDAIQAFVGTPQDLASRLGKGLVHTQWRLASANLIADVLSDDLVAVYFELGPRYFGNFQDCLGSFQTYCASAALNLRNESLHPGREERSDIITAIRSKAGVLLPETKVLLNISAATVLDDDDYNNIDESRLLKFISKAAGKNLRNVTKGGRNALAINGAVPSINEALLRSSGFAILTGDPVVVVPQSLDDAAWRIGGCASVCLTLLEDANSPDAILRALKILSESVQDNWRNSEAMEREHGFGVLSTLLKMKLSQQSPNSPKSLGSMRISESVGQPASTLSLHVLAELLRFLGYDADKPRDSVINNPLAYRILLVDMGFWRNAELEVQRLYYEQFIVFGVRSKYHLFNTKRLSRMRITKKWLDALKGEVFTAEAFSYFLESFKSMLTISLSADSMRALALYITYAIHQPKQNTLVPLRSRSVKLNTDTPGRRKTLGSQPPRPEVQDDTGPLQFTQLQIALRILELYTELLCQKGDSSNIHKFARTVTNKWLLHLLADNEPTVVVLATKILARLLVVSGPDYVEKFVDKTGGVIIMQYRLKRWWNVPTIWLICFAVLFGIDVGTIDFSRPFDLLRLLEVFASNTGTAVVYPIMLPVITSMLGEGLKVVARDQLDPDSPLLGRGSTNGKPSRNSPGTPSHSRQRSTTLDLGSSTSRESEVPKYQQTQLAQSVSTLHTITRFLADIHTKSQAFRDFTTTSLYIQEMFFVLFPLIVSANPVNPETELNSRESALTFMGGDVMMRPLSANAKGSAPIVRMSTVEPSHTSKPHNPPVPKRISSYILVTSDSSRLSTRKLPSIVSPERTKVAINLSSSIVEELLELTIAVYSDQIFSRKDFPGLGLFMRVPPGFQEHQAFFETFILRNTMSHLDNALKLDQKLLWEPRVLTNIARFAGHLGEAIYEGWFINGAEDTLEFLANILEYLQLPSISSIKAVRLCSHIVSNIREVLLRVVLLKLSDIGETNPVEETVAFLNRLAYWQTVLLPVDNLQQNFHRLLYFLVYNRLMSTNLEVRTAAANLWRMLSTQKPDEIENVLQQAVRTNPASLIKGLKKIIELDNETFLDWLDDHRGDLEGVLLSPLSKSWEMFVMEENRRTEETARARISKRREKLKLWVSDGLAREEILRRHETGTDHWRSNIYAAEALKRQRSLQDYLDSQVFNTTTWAKMRRDLLRPCGAFATEDRVTKWELDQTEGRNRMRLRFLPDKDAHLHDYQPKRRQSQGPVKHRHSVSAKSKHLVDGAPPLPDQASLTAKVSEALDTSSPATATHSGSGDEDDGEIENDFEIIDDPKEDSEEHEDKNRKVMRSLQRGDQVEHVHNVSRIVGLEAIEGLLILGKGHLYLLDDLFQRADGEVVNVWQAPAEERDSYLQMISGRESGSQASSRTRADFETRYWRWEDVLSISKRRFLFRDVSIEVFFVDGRSYLLTTNTPMLRNELHQKLLSKTSAVSDFSMGPANEDSWRIDSLRSPGDDVQTLGSKFTSVFAQQNSNTTTRRWLKGEISNFHYLMFINTMAGRTFNDLTQYPVFPWVLADYTSEDLDLTNPRTFRDLSKPMGCQNPDRQAEFRDRYQSFAEMGDEHSPPFHYGTHYSSAMIVTSYLIRMQPFVNSYLLLQGGSFDHPDRLFYSVEKAWSSASRENMTDVRELIPEFYYLPEFLENHNGYDFGTRQGSGGTIDSVSLPPWAKGDPKMFIAKHREALESEYVSQHLHQWIDLVFGHKQRGEAALEATNVFHHLSYHGAKNLDTISDPVERLATIGIIHNFGQTPHQIFQRGHLPQEDKKRLTKRLDTCAENLTRLPFPIVESSDRISSLQYSMKNDRLMCSGPFQIHIGPTFDKYLEWGFIDGSVRFFSADSKRPIGLFEHVHQGQLSYVLFVDSKTLVTAGSDCTVSIWNVISTSGAVDLQPKTCLFGHRSAVTMLAVSRSFRALLSASSDGQVLLWDLNRLELVRQLNTGDPVECARINDVTGTIMLCRGFSVSLWTLNGELILEQDIHVEGDDLISACAFYEGSGTEYLERNLVFTGHRKGVVNVWNISTLFGSFSLEHVKRMHHLDHAGYNIGATITAILPMAQKVYTGDDDGRVYEWDCIQRQ